MHALKIDPSLEAEEAFVGYIEQEDFPCLAAKTAIARDHVTFFHGSSIDCPAHDRALLTALIDFAQPSDAESPFRSFAALFPSSPDKTPREFESALWQRLQRLHDLDVLQSPWDETVSCDPSSPDFSMSLGGHAFYVVGLHPASTRRARRFPITAMVFNLHRQFEQLREEKRYHRFSEAIIERDVAFHGSANPMLDEHGSSSEARQYSGRVVSADWICPFKPRS
ncbi:MAG: guanitoxin biosynthesis heme-dependent pre-guanitoxin N-hydroxylase GntA [Rhodanobacter sp.]